MRDPLIDEGVDGGEKSRLFSLDVAKDVNERAAVCLNAYPLRLRIRIMHDRLARSVVALKAVTCELEGKEVRVNSGFTFMRHASGNGTVQGQVRMASRSWEFRCPRILSMRMMALASMRRWDSDSSKDPTPPVRWVRRAPVGCR